MLAHLIKNISLINFVFKKQQGNYSVWELKVSGDQCSSSVYFSDIQLPGALARYGRLDQCIKYPYPNESLK